MRKIGLAGCLLVFAIGGWTQNSVLRHKMEKALNDYFLTYTARNTDFGQQPRLQSLTIDDKMRRVTVATSDAFAQQEFTNKQVGRIYKHVKHALVKPYSGYELRVTTNGMLIEQYVPGHVLSDADGHALWGRTDYDGRPWVSNASAPTRFTHGLYNRHLTVWASHGRYYDNKKALWKWQRPIIFGTTEDLFTQTIVVPYLIPMLEKAGAVVFTPRERDWQAWEYIVDPDGGLNTLPNDYREYAERDSWTYTTTPGFSAHAGSYLDGENPFAAGRSRQIKTTKKDGKAYAKWQPNFIKAGRYAVYVSYQTVPGSVDDAHYTVFHKGQATEFRVNQQMGGGTWVYLGTFDFGEGDHIDNCVMLTNQSRHHGVVTADAVRFGGGIGNIERGGTTSGYPRAIEGARYWAQWAGAPYTVYGGRNGTDDYADDINTRSRMLNWLAGGSVFVPTLSGKKVPMELSLAVHSDAGYAKDGVGLVGSLAICTTDFNDGRLDAGISRTASKLFAEELLSGVTRDLSYQYKSWARRYLWDRNYSETRLPEVPAAILETMSHQNFPDMLLGQDPHFKFTLARSIYKTIARYVNGMHGHATVIAPLAPTAVSVELARNEAQLSWTMQPDRQEPTATPTYYILYTAIGNGGFDNGRKVKGTTATVDLQPGIPYHFKVSAANRGGESFASEVVSACVQPGATQTVLVVNGFQRLSAPAVVNNDTQQGFDLDADPGVTRGVTAGWCGLQSDFDRAHMGIEGEGGLGYGGNELAGKFIAGNDFNYTMAHATAIASARKYNVASCSSRAVETGKVRLERYAAVDLILGLQRYMPDALAYDKTFPAQLQSRLSAYTAGGGCVLASGAYIGTDMSSETDAAWLAQTLKASPGTSIKTDSISGANGLGLTFDFFRLLNADHYAATRANVLQPSGGAVCAMQYSNGLTAATAYDGPRGRTFVMGFPFECITDPAMRNRLMQGIMNYLLK
ncbi:golvesin C-terminal-like domain-containing protein [Hallella seregens]|uniref:Fibronectin type III domain-containing protein n=1 Tax=Hallella seregens ATCC 51272 TaxID=1336250 RepID=A0ABV5ZII4_9BACT|nr:xanthan lyase [Hallella seregens]